MRLSLPLLLLFALGSCGGGGESFGLTERILVAGLSFPTGAADPTRARIVRAFPQLRLPGSLYLTHPPDGTDRIFVVEQAGLIHLFANDDAVTSTTVFLDLRPKIRAGGEEGLLGLAFDPDYAVNGYFYVQYTAVSGARRSVIARYRVSANPSFADAASETILLEVPQPFSNHNGGVLAFGPDRMLYIGLGDGGSAGDPGNRAQDPTTLLGKILRLDPHRPAPYVPPDNPFVGRGGGTREEIFALGLRNPWRLSFDRATGALWVGDVGQGSWEEIDLVEAGDNLGWRVYEGNHSYNNPSMLPPSDFKAPVIEYSHALGQSVTGGYVYRGLDVPSLSGLYLYGDFASGRVWALEYDGARVVSNTEVGNVSSLASFGEDRDGELYAVSLSGEIWRFAEGPGGGPPAAFPGRLSETGLFADLATLEPSPGVVEYDVNAPLWSDGARKRRFLALPGRATIGFQATDAWTFPAGTVLVKHFEIDVAPGTTRRLETRVLLRAANAWEGYTYRWNEAGTDADLLDGAESATFDVADADGARTQTWNFPGRADCLACHTAAAGGVLGLRTGQMNRDFAYAARTDNQLRAWNHIGLFGSDIGPAGSHARWPDPEDGLAPVAARARSYLASNCANCHRPGGPTPTDLDLRFETPVGLTRLVGVAPTHGDLGIAGAARVAPGSKETSVLWERMRRLDGTRMPPLGSNLAHGPAIGLVGAWIDAGAE